MELLGPDLESSEPVGYCVSSWEMTVVQGADHGFRVSCGVVSKRAAIEDG